VKEMKIMLALFVSLAVLSLLISSSDATQSTAAMQNTPAVRFVTPQPGEKIQQSAVTVRYAIDQPQAVAASTPAFNLRLDGRDPVRTEEKESTFTGLAPGAHTLAIEIVDANGTPVPGTHSEIQFTVAPEPASNAATSPATTSPAQNNQATPSERKRRREKPQQNTPPQVSLPAPPWAWESGLTNASFKIALPDPMNSGSGAPDNGRLAQDGNLPESASALPLLTVIGAGVLIGGLFSARRTRRNR
jgi:hypothetical protein